MKINNELLERVSDGWDAALENANAVSFCDGDLDEELFRQTMYDTWELFRNTIEFEASDEEYSLPIGLAEILGEITAYSKMYQITDEPDCDSIDIPAMICGLMLGSIIHRTGFSREKPAVKGRRLFDNTPADIEYDLVTGELTLSDPPETIKQFVLDENGDPIEPHKLGQPVVKNSIARW